MSDPKEPRPFPTIPESIIVELNKRFPECCADLEWPVKQIYFMAGQRAVIRFLNQLYNEQQESVL